MIKRMHVALNCTELNKSLEFYRAFFGAEPSKVKDNYAKFELEEPALHFSLNVRPFEQKGVLNHLGFQVNNTEEVLAMGERLRQSGLLLIDEMNTTCCYAVQDLLLQQKTVTVDFLSHKRVKNRGQEQQYFIEDNHEPIISKEIFDAVQKEKERRAYLKGNVVGDRKKYSSKYPLSGKVFCGCCGANFKRRTWNSNNIFKKVVWQCRTYVNEGKATCDAKAVDELELQDAFVRVFNRMYENKGNFIRTLNANIEAILSKRDSHESLLKLEKSIEQLKSDLKGLVNLKLRDQIEESVYAEENTRITEELDELRHKKALLEKDLDQKEQIRSRVNEIIQVVNARQQILEQFEDDLFNALVEKITILSPAHFIFTLKSELEIEEVIE